jgi:hypothetical protein
MQKRRSHFGETGTAVFAGEGVEQGGHDVRPRWRARHGAAGVAARSDSDRCGVRRLDRDFPGSQPR